MLEKMFEKSYKGVFIEVWRGDITEFSGIDAIVNPANSLMYMGGGVAGAIKRVGGDEIEKEALEKAPVPVGKAIMTGSGKMKGIKAVIHAPTMEKPAMRTSISKVEMATTAALECAEENGLESLAFPGMGTGVGGVSYDDAAETMVNAIKNFVTKGTNLKRIILVGFTEELTNAFGRYVRKLEE
ncbi:MAG: macro domain-containing protein [Candidatus Asgardarchaeia archaeon]